MGAVTGDEMSEQMREEMREGMIWINGEAQPHEAVVTLDALMQDLYGDVPLRGVAVALDGAVVPRSQWATQTIEANARLEIIRATQGG